VRRAIAMEERHGLCLVLALAVSAKEAMRLVVQAPFQSSSRCGLLVSPVRRALQRSESCGRRCSCCFSVWARIWWRWAGIVSWSRVSLGTLRAGQGHLHIQCRSESGARQRGHRALMSLAWGSWVYMAYREPSTFQPVMSFRMVARRA
jgi:hypothetical protein